MHLNGTLKNTWNWKQCKNSVTLNSELHRSIACAYLCHQCLLFVGGVGELGNKFHDNRPQRFEYQYYVKNGLSHYVGKRKILSFIEARIYIANLPPCLVEVKCIRC